MMSYQQKKIFIVSAVLLAIVILILSSQRLAWSKDTADFLDQRPLEHSPVVPANPSISSRKAAAIVETRALDNLIPIVLHFSSILGPEWPIHIFTSSENQGIFAHSLPFQRNVDAGRFHVRALPENATLNTHAAISAFYTKPWFWEAMAPAERILMFQADSVICSNSPQQVEDYLEYDFVGAPIDAARGLGVGYNGGLSIRNRAMCLDIVNTYDWETERHGDHSEGNIDYEDQWFVKKMRELPAQADESPAALLPAAEIAMKFAVETMWYDKPLGFHQASVWQKDKMEEIFSWCPEYKMCTVETFTDHNPDA